MRCLIIDDDKMQTAVLERYVSQTDNLDLIDTCSNAADALSILFNESIDLVFLETKALVKNGIEILNNVNPRPQIIVHTTQSDYAVEAFEQGVTDYLLKPCSYARFFKAATRARIIAERQRSKPLDHDHIFVKSSSRIVKINTKHILWVEALKDYVCINIPREKILTHSTIKRMAARLPSEEFIRIHRSFIVPLDKISYLEDNSLVIDKKVFPIGKSYREALINRIGLG